MRANLDSTPESSHGVLRKRDLVSAMRNGLRDLYRLCIRLASRCKCRDSRCKPASLRALAHEVFLLSAVRQRLGISDIPGGPSAILLIEPRSGVDSSRFIIIVVVY